jgi:cysteine desulfurase
LYVRSVKPRVKPEPIIHGGGQERSIRSGTLNVPGIVGFGKAIEITMKEMSSESKRFGKWSKKMLEEFEKIGAELNGHPTKRLSHNLHVYFPKIESKSIINSICKEIAISAGSACTTQLVEPSHVIIALGFDEERAHSSIRIGLGRMNTENEVQYAITRITSAVEKIKKIMI